MVRFSGHRVGAPRAPGWELQDLQCTSTGLQPHLRGSDWLAEAWGPAGECIKVDACDPAEALLGLADQLQLRLYEH